MHPWCGKTWKGQHKAARPGKKRKVCRYCRKRDCADPCGARREAEWFAEGRAHMAAMRAYGPFFTVEAGADWGQLQRKHLRGTHWWCRHVPTPTGRRAITNCPDLPGSTLVENTPAAEAAALAWVYAEYDIGDGRKARRYRDNFEALARTAEALGYLFNGGPGPAEPKEPDPPWVDDAEGSGLPKELEIIILEAADPPVPYDWKPGSGLSYDITGHPQEDELGVRLRADGWGIDGYAPWWTE